MEIASAVTWYGPHWQDAEGVRMPYFILFSEYKIRCDFASKNEKTVPPDWGGTVISMANKVKRYMIILQRFAI